MRPATWISGPAAQRINHLLGGLDKARGDGGVQGLNLGAHLVLERQQLVDGRNRIAAVNRSQCRSQRRDQWLGARDVVSNRRCQPVHGLGSGKNLDGTGVGGS